MGIGKYELGFKFKGKLLLLGIIILFGFVIIVLDVEVVGVLMLKFGLMLM